MTSHSPRRRALAALALLSASLLAAGCAQQPPTPRTPPARTYVLVHGAFEDSSIWDAVRQELERAGQHVIAIDLPGRAGDATPLADLTLDAYRDTVERALAGLHEPAVLVGHSFGGITISNVAERHPEQVRTLVYVAALLPRDGDSAVALSRQDKSNGITHDAFVFSADRHRVSVLAQDQPALFCADCPPALAAARFPARMMAEPVAPLATPVRLSSERYGRVDKVYIATDADRIVSPDAQRAMLAATPTREVVHLASSHSPFLSEPAELARVLLATTR